MTQPQLLLSTGYRIRLHIALLLLAPASAAWAQCPQDQVAVALDRLETSVVGQLDPAQRRQATDILAHICAGAGRAAAEANNTPTMAAGAPALQKSNPEDAASDPETTNILGMEIRKGGPDSKGRKRLKTKR